MAKNTTTTMPHVTLRADGKKTAFKSMTDKLCPVCNPVSKGARLGITADSGDTETLECEYCGYTEYNRAK